MASLPISKSLEMKSDESGFSESMHLSYATPKTPSYSTASTQTPPELNLPEDDLQIGNTLIQNEMFEGQTALKSCQLASE